MPDGAVEGWSAPAPGVPAAGNIRAVTSPDFCHRRAAGTSLLVALCEDDGGRTTPVVLHWGADLGELSADEVADLVRARVLRAPHSALDTSRWLGVLPDNGSGFTGTPAVEGWRAEPSGTWAPRFTGWTLTADGTGLRLDGADDEAGLAVAVELDLTAEGLVRTRTGLTNTAGTPYVVSALRSVLPVGPEAGEVLDLTGRWIRERAPQRRPFLNGTWERAGRHGRTGHDATLLMVAGTPGFGFTSGTVWGVHLGWSGDTVHYAERTPEGESLLGAGELLGPGEVELAPGTTYTSPWTYGAWSDRGLDGMSARLHAWQRTRPLAPRTPRKVLVNTWEAVYFDHDLDRLTALADAAAEVGAERFVLDDGWFRGRRDDNAGLGDWTVDATVWPRGLHPLVEHVHAKGMDFGLWVEPEMVNVDSDLVRAHPDWVLRGRAELPPEWRFQQVLDLQHPDAYAHVRDALLALLAEYDIAFLKWDHNRDLVDVAHAGRPAVHGQTEALYRLLAELQAAHPGLEIETCASGGGRVDLGILGLTQRLWPSDTIDALERQEIQRWTTLLVPPEMVGAHIGSPTAHTTGRTHGLPFRAATALLGHLGIEWDLTTASPDDRAAVAAWVDLHKQVRHLVSDGVLVRADHPDPAVRLTGLVAADGSEAVYVLAAVASSVHQAPPPTRLPGLDPARRYRVREVTPGREGRHSAERRSWVSGDGLVLGGATLGQAGIRVPVMLPETARVLRCEALPD